MQQFALYIVMTAYNKVLFDSSAVNPTKCPCVSQTDVEGLGCGMSVCFSFKVLL